MSENDHHDSVGVALLRVLRNYGVDTIFGLPGTHSVEFYRGVRALGMHAVTTRHEQGAGYAADAWGQIRRLPGVVIPTAGPGSLNVMSAAATAYAESRPMIIFSPGAPLAPSAAVGTLHETRDLDGAYRAILGRSTRVGSGREAIETLHDAFRLFATQRPGPVHIEIPLDVLEGPCEVAPAVLARREFKLDLEPPAAEVARAAELLAGAQRPVIVAGAGATDAVEPLQQLVERLQAPVVTSINGKAALSELHPLSLGANLRLGACVSLCNQADVLLVVGSKVGEAELWGHVFEPTGKVIRIDIDAARMHANFSPEIGLRADAGVALAALLRALSDAPAAAAKSVDSVRQQMLREARELSPALTAISEAIAPALPADAILCGDSSQISYLACTTFLLQDKPHRFMYMPTYATLGYGVPAALGAKLAAPEQPVISILGDGALMFSVQELMTIVEQGLDVTLVCIDNGGYREIHQNMADAGIDPAPTDLQQPDWCALAAAFGFHTQAVAADDGAALTAAVRAAVAHAGPAFVHVTLAV